jgi:hypothetical protein
MSVLHLDFHFCVPVVSRAQFLADVGSCPCKKRVERKSRRSFRIQRRSGHTIRGER